MFVQNFQVYKTELIPYLPGANKPVEQMSIVMNGVLSEKSKEWTSIRVVVLPKGNSSETFCRNRI